MQRPFPQCLGFQTYPVGNQGGRSPEKKMVENQAMINDQRRPKKSAPECHFECGGGEGKSYLGNAQMPARQFKWGFPKDDDDR